MNYNDMAENYPADPNNFDRGTDRPHTARYLLARGFLRPSYKVIDAACGYGYGTNLLSKYCQEVVGYDKHSDLIELHCQHTYPELKFKVADFETEAAFADEKCNAFVCIETIEHLADPQAFLDKVVKITSDRIIISSPNKLTAGVNPYHKTDVTLVQLQKLMDKYKEDWIYYHSFLQGEYYIAIYVNRKSRIVA